MDSHRFDALVRGMAHRTSRRSVLTAGVATLAGVVATFKTSPAAALCIPPLTDCFGNCVNLDTSEKHCGSCGASCDTTCIDGFCLMEACFPPNVWCGDDCIDLMTDPNNCGSCGVVCDLGCAIGICTVFACIVPETPCGDECVDLQTDVRHCGACFSECEGGVPQPGHSSIPECQDGICISPCLPDADYCGGDCTDLSIDVLNCGECGHLCPFLTTCCGGNCVDENSAERFCDYCGYQAGWPQGCLPDEVCAGGLCIPTCPAGESLCGDSCVDLQSDPNNCGECARNCAHQAGWGICCNGECIDQTKDEAHCGTCDIACDPGEECVDGLCAGGEVVDEGPYALWTGKTRLRGAHIVQRRVALDDDPDEMGDGPVGPPYRRDDFEALAALGANYVVIDHPAIVDPEDGDEVDADLADNLESLVNDAARAGLWVVIALRSGPGLPESALGESIVCQAGGCLDRPAEGALEEPELFDRAGDRDSWAAAWRAIARQYRDDPSVIGYQLLTWVDPRFADDWEDLAAEWIDEIRDEDESMPILIPAPGSIEEGLARRWTRDPLAVHVVDFFVPERFVMQLADDPSLLTYPGRLNEAMDDERGAFDQDWLDEKLDPIVEFEDRYEMPVAISAVGTPRWQPGAADFLHEGMTVFEHRGLNYAVWMWYPERWGSADTFDYTRGEDPDEHEPVDSDLMDALEDHWGKNREQYEQQVIEAA